MTLYRLRLGPKDKDSAIIYDFEMPDTFWDKWHRVEFLFKVNDSGERVAHAQIVPERKIYITERWYHRLINFIYLKFRKCGNEQF